MEMKINRNGKSYIGKEEAFEIMLERNIKKLPRKGFETWTVRQVPQSSLILGKDENGFYIDECLSIVNAK